MQAFAEDDMVGDIHVSEDGGVVADAAVGADAGEGLHDDPLAQLRRAGDKRVGLDEAEELRAFGAKFGADAAPAGGVADGADEQVVRLRIVGGGTGGTRPNGEGGGRGGAGGRRRRWRRRTGRSIADRSRWYRGYAADRERHRGRRGCR